MSSCAFTSDEKGNWYIASSIGISRLLNGGSTWETIVDGVLTSLGMPSYSIDTILPGGQEDFYVMYQYGEGQRDIKHYRYDKDVPSTPSQTLTVISLNENATIRQAINEYRKTNQDVKVDYRVMMNGEDGIPVEDNIKLINTELMAGKGADIILFDGMSVDPYIEKGVLADISSMIKPLIESGELQDNVMDRYQKDGAIYAASLRFLMPFVFGKQEAVNSTKSMQFLADYAENKAALSLFGEQVYSYAELSSKLYQLYADRFIGMDKKFNREELIRFLEQMKIIYLQTKIREEMGDLSTGTDTILPAMLIYEKYAELGLINIESSFDTYAAISAVMQTEGEFASIREQYIPSGIIGINNASLNKEIAGDFIKVLYSYEVQNNELSDGLPVNAKALDNFGMEPNDYHISGPEGFEATQPSEEIRKQIITLAKSLKTPIREEEVLKKMILSEMQPFFTGEAKAEEIADQIIHKVEVYLSE
jgi:ABC-type glycerol-3-phosphate transport system substrate-binding protein